MSPASKVMLKILQAGLQQYVNRELPSSQSYGFSNSHVWMWQLDNKEIWAPKNWWFWTVVLEKTLESPLDCKEIQPVHPKGNQSWIFIGRTDILKLKLQYFGHLMWRTDSFVKTLMLGKIEGRRRRDDRGWDGWMASPTWWTWVWVNSGSWWRTGKPDMRQSMGSQRVRHSDWTELNPLLASVLLEGQGLFLALGLELFCSQFCVVVVLILYCFVFILPSVVSFILPILT